ncbi:MAG TPA: DUF362 domain-containing protein [Chloroflexi bacterium]|jgi:uncharacterized protein (DUF362 family)|nr:DUF362 domain-containing protein [Chloroflexota bacterium]
MRLSPVLQDPQSVFVYRRAVPEIPSALDFEATAIEALTALRLELEGEAVVLKPNVTAGEFFRDPDSGITTHPAFIGGMVRYLRAHGAAEAIHIIEDPHNQDDESPASWEGTGYLEMAHTVGARLAAPTRGTVVRREVPHPLVHAAQPVSSLAVAPDTVYINVPKLKTHNLAITTLCLKNQMGLVYVLDRHYCAQAMAAMDTDGIDTDRPREEWMDATLNERWQEGLAQRLADLAQVVTPQLNVVEGVVGRDGTGFQRGTNYPLGLVVAGVNMVAVDAVASYLMGFDPQKLIYLRVAAEVGLGVHDLSQLRVYTLEDGALTPCIDVERYRAQTPFAVIRNMRANGTSTTPYR